MTRAGSSADRSRTARSYFSEASDQEGRSHGGFGRLAAAYVSAGSRALCAAARERRARTSEPPRTGDQATFPTRFTRCGEAAFSGMSDPVASFANPGRPRVLQDASVQHPGVGGGQRRGHPPDRSRDGLPGAARRCCVQACGSSTSAAAPAGSATRSLITTGGGDRPGLQSGGNRARARGGGGDEAVDHVHRWRSVPFEPDRAVRPRRLARRAPSHGQLRGRGTACLRETSCKPGGHVLIGLYHTHGRKPLLDHFQAMKDRGATEERDVGRGTGSSTRRSRTRRC